eukprot:gene143-239_t
MRFIRDSRQFSRQKTVDVLRHTSEIKGHTSDHPIDLTRYKQQITLIGDVLSFQERLNLSKIQKMLDAMRKECLRTCMVKHVSDLLTTDVYSLQPWHFCNILQNRCIDDTVVDAYLLLLRDHAYRAQNKTLVILNTHVFVMLRSGDDTEKLIFAGLDKYFTSTTRYYYSPVLVDGNHWISLVFDIVKMRVCIYDSFHSDVSRYESYLRPAIRAIAQLHYKDDRTDVTSFEATITNITGMPRQTNAYDCGVYMLAHARALCEAVNMKRVSLGKNVERYGRRRLVLSLHECRVV